MIKRYKPKFKPITIEDKLYDIQKRLGRIERNIICILYPIPGKGKR
jgi:hypothetical protein